MRRDLSEGEGWVVKITIWVLSLPEAAKLKVPNMAVQGWYNTTSFPPKTI